MTLASAKALRVLLIVRELSAEKGFPPTLREIKARLGGRVQTTAGVRAHLTTLADAGLLTFYPKLARSILLTVAGKNRTENTPAEVS